jgi:hypothetical protein
MGHHRHRSISSEGPPSPPLVHHPHRAISSDRGSPPPPPTCDHHHPPLFTSTFAIPTQRALLAFKSTFVLCRRSASGRWSSTAAVEHHRHHRGTSTVTVDGLSSTGHHRQRAIATNGPSPPPSPPTCRPRQRASDPPTDHRRAIPTNGPSPPLSPPTRRRRQRAITATVTANTPSPPTGQRHQRRRHRQHANGPAPPTGHRRRRHRQHAVTANGPSLPSPSMVARRRAATTLGPNPMPKYFALRLYQPLVIKSIQSDVCGS